MSQIVLMLDDVIFDYFEVPSKISLGAEQRMTVHRLIGNRRIVDAMGADDLPLAWQGTFRGPNATDRARKLNRLTKSGRAVTCSWGQLSYSVCVRRFEWDFEAGFQIPYTITCEVIEDLATPDTPAPDPGVDAMMGSDGQTVTAIAAKIGDAPLSGLTASLDTAIKNVSSFAKATTATINGVLAPIQAVQGRVDTLISQSSRAMEGVTTLGGVLPFNPIAKNAAGLLNQVANVTRLPDLYDFDASLGRMTTNLASIGVSGKLVQVTGDLYHLAASEYGDPSAWTGIARANGLVDPVLDGIQDLRVPPTADDFGGVLTS